MEKIQGGTTVYFTYRGTLDKGELINKTRKEYHRSCYNINFNSSEGMMEEIRILSENIGK